MPDIFVNQATLRVRFNSGSRSGTSAPSSGTSEVWTIEPLSAAWPSLSAGQTLSMVDPSQPSEIIRITSCTGVGAINITVTRGADSTTPVHHNASASFVSNGAVASALDAFDVASGGAIVDAGGQVFNVKAYGAVGDNSTDDTTNIQSAITAAAAVKGIVFFPPATYKLTAALTCTTAGVTFMGCGPLSSILHQTSTTANGLSVISSGTLSDLMVIGLGITGPGSGSGIGLIFQSNSGASIIPRIKVSNVTIQSMGSHGFEFNNCGLTDADNCYSTNNGGRGFYCINGTTYHFRCCYALSNVNERGFYLSGSETSLLESCGSDNNAIGYEISGGGGIRIVACDSFNTLAGSSGLDGSSFKVSGGCAWSAVESITIGSNGSNGLYVTGNSTCDVLGMTEGNSGVGGPFASIKADSGSSLPLITSLAVNSALSLATGTEGVAIVSGLMQVGVNAQFLGTVSSGIVSPSGVNTGAAGAAVITPTLASGTASQLSDLTRDYELYLDCTTAGTGFTLAIGPTSTPANTIINSTVAVAGVLYHVRVPAGWFVKATWTTAAFTQKAISC